MLYLAVGLAAALPAAEAFGAALACSDNFGCDADDWCEAGACVHGPCESSDDCDGDLLCHRTGVCLSSDAGAFYDYATLENALCADVEEPIYWYFGTMDADVVVADAADDSPLQSGPVQGCAGLAGNLGLLSYRFGDYLCMALAEEARDELSAVFGNEWYEIDDAAGVWAFCTDLGSPAGARQCFNGELDGDEVDVDCGGDFCGLCDAGQQCAADADCWQACTDDGVCLNDYGQGCVADEECVSGFCDPDELVCTGLGDAEVGDACADDSDCATELCDADTGLCVAAVGAGCASDSDCPTDTTCHATVAGNVCLSFYSARFYDLAAAETAYCADSGDDVTFLSVETSMNVWDDNSDVYPYGTHAVQGCVAFVTAGNQNIFKFDDYFCAFLDEAYREELSAVFGNTFFNVFVGTVYGYCTDLGVGGAPQCSNGELDGDEVDVDCGGEFCGRCDAGQQCAADADCFGQCTDAGVCLTDYGQGCAADEECVSGFCDPDALVCQGSGEAATGDACADDSDCASALCDADAGGVCVLDNGQLCDSDAECLTDSTCHAGACLTAQAAAFYDFATYTETDMCESVEGFEALGYTFYQAVTYIWVDSPDTCVGPYEYGSTDIAGCGGLALDDTLSVFRLEDGVSCASVYVEHTQELEDAFGWCFLMAYGGVSGYCTSAQTVA